MFLAFGPLSVNSTKGNGSRPYIYLFDYQKLLSNSIFYFYQSALITFESMTGFKLFSMGGSLKLKILI